MEAFYFVVFGFLVAVVAALELSKNSKDRINTLSSFNAFKNNYLLVYSLMMCRILGGIATSLLFSAFSLGLLLNRISGFFAKKCGLFHIHHILRDGACYRMAYRVVTTVDHYKFDMKKFVYLISSKNLSVLILIGAKITDQEAPTVMGLGLAASMIEISKAAWHGWRHP